MRPPVRLNRAQSRTGRRKLGGVDEERSCPHSRTSFQSHLAVIRFAIAMAETDVEQVSAVGRENRDPCESSGELVLVRRECFPFGHCVPIETQIPEDPGFRHVAEPFDAVSEDGQGRVVHGLAFHGPASISDHDLVHREAFFGAANGDMSPDFRDSDHHVCLTKNPLLGGPVVHDAGAPADRPLGLETSVKQDSGVPHFPFGREVGELLLAVCVLAVGRVVGEKAKTHTDGADRPLEFVEVDEPAARNRRLGFAGLHRVVECRGLGRRRRLGRLLGLSREDAGQESQGQQASHDTRLLHWCLLTGVTAAT